MSDPKGGAWLDPRTGEPVFVSGQPSPTGRLSLYFHTIDSAHADALAQDSNRTARLSGVRFCPRYQRGHTTVTSDSCAIPLPGPDAEVEE